MYYSQVDLIHEVLETGSCARREHSPNPFPFKKQRLWHTPLFYGLRGTEGWATLTNPKGLQKGRGCYPILEGTSYPQGCETIIHVLIYFPGWASLLIVKLIWMSQSRSELFVTDQSCPKPLHLGTKGRLKEGGKRCVRGGGGRSYITTALHTGKCAIDIMNNYKNTGRRLWLTERSL